MNGWLAGQVVCKLLIYFGLATVIGGVFCLNLTQAARNLMAVLRGYFLVSVVLGLLASILSFFLKVGYLAESGVGGMFDSLYLTILWSSSVGAATAWQASGFGILLIAILWLVSGSQTSKSTDALGPWFIWALIAPGVLMVIRSISMVGHPAGINVTAQIAIALHAFAGLWWLGSLVPLHASCTRLANPSLHQLMHRFGNIALVVVLMLLATGGWVALELFTFPAELVTTAYGRSFLIKISLVMGLLSFALWHKARLVPSLLHRPSSAHSLKRSIRIETFVGIAVLIATAILTTAVGPAHVS